MNDANVSHYYGADIAEGGSRPGWYEPITPVEAIARDRWLGTFYPFQRRYLLDETRVVVLCHCRQVGASWTNAGAAVLRATYHRIETSIYCVSFAEAIAVRDMCLRHLAILRQLGSESCKTVSVLVRDNAVSVIANGPQVETAVTVENLAFWKGPIVEAQSGQFRVSSSIRPDGETTLFDEFLTHQGGRSVHMAPRLVAHSEGFPLRERDLREPASDSMEFRRMFDCWTGE